MVTALALVGCAPRMAFVRPDAGPADHQRDIAQCEYEIQMNQPTGGGRVWFRNNSEALGYAIGTAIGMAARTERLRTLCMQGRGYTAVALEGGTMPISEPQPSLPAIAAPVQQGRGDIRAAAPAPIAATPAVAGIKSESKYMVTAEGVAKASGCTPPSVAMTAKGAESESFMVGCPNGTTMAIRCEIDGCRILK